MEQELTKAMGRKKALERNGQKPSLEWSQQHHEYINAKAAVEWYQGLIQKLSRRALKLRESSNLGARFLDRTFDNFDFRIDRKAYDQCLAYSERKDLFEIDRNGLLLFGSVGSGKTHLSAAIANSLVERGIPVLFGTFSEHLERIRADFERDEARYLSMMKNIPLLVLDDMGKEKQTEWTQQIMFDVINARYEHKLPIIITSNYDQNELATYLGHPIMSRLFEMCSAVHTSGGDYRLCPLKKTS